MKYWFTRQTSYRHFFMNIFDISEILVLVLMPLQLPTEFVLNPPQIADDINTLLIFYFLQYKPFFTNTKKNRFGAVGQELWVDFGNYFLFL